MNELKKYTHLETLSAKLLLGAALLAIFLSNSPFKAGYEVFRSHTLFLINDVFMTIFFLVIGLEIKFELLRGALSSWKKAALPVAGALGGMVVPAVIYVAFNQHDLTLLRGWAVPTATDIAFALSILSLLGSRISDGLKLFVMALAVLDDLAAILIIAFFLCGFCFSDFFKYRSCVCYFIIYVK